MADRFVVSSAQRDTLADRLKTDQKFRQLMKSDWRAAFQDAGVDVKAIEGKNLEYSEAVPLDSGPVQAGIIITIFNAAQNAEEVSLKESVLFTK